MYSSPTHILFDFFGTLVDHSAALTEQLYPKSFSFIRKLDASVDYDEFRKAWATAHIALAKATAVDDVEFSMRDVARDCLESLLTRLPAPAEVSALARQYVDEWNVGVHYHSGIGDLIASLRGYNLAVVTNTHDPDLVPNHLRAMGILSNFDGVFTSVEIGFRKPHPAIFEHTMQVLGIKSSDAIFVGDTYGPDFLGPQRLGIFAYLIDPGRRASVPSEQRLRTVFELPDRVAAIGRGAPRLSDGRC